MQVFLLVEAISCGLRSCGGALISALRVGKPDPPAGPGGAGITGGVAGRLCGADRDVQPLLDRLVARELHVAEQTVDLARHPVGRGDISIGRNGDRHQDRPDRDDDQQFDHREAELPDSRVHGNKLPRQGCMKLAAGSTWANKCDAVHNFGCYSGTTWGRGRAVGSGYYTPTSTCRIISGINPSSARRHGRADIRPLPPHITPPRPASASPAPPDAGWCQRAESRRPGTAEPARDTEHS